MITGEEMNSVGLLRTKQDRWVTAATFNATTWKHKELHHVPAANHLDDAYGSLLASYR